MEYPKLTPKARRAVLAPDRIMGVEIPHIRRRHQT